MKKCNFVCNPWIFVLVVVLTLSFPIIDSSANNHIAEEKSQGISLAFSPQMTDAGVEKLVEQTPEYLLDSQVKTPTKLKGPPAPATGLIAILDSTATPSYAVGSFGNSYTNIYNGLVSEGLPTITITNADILSGALGNVTVLIMIDNLPSDPASNVTKNWYFAGGNILIFDSSICFLNWAGILPPEANGTNGINIYWDYDAPYEGKVINANHPVMAGYTLDQSIYGTAGDAQYFRSVIQGTAAGSDYTSLVANGTSGSADLVAAYDPELDGRAVFIWDELNWGTSTNRDMILNAVKWLREDRKTTIARTLTGPVAVFEDQDPWTYNDTEEILDVYNIPYDRFGSSDFGSVDLSGYQKVIISSAQDYLTSDDSFYRALESNRTWLEDYVKKGGILEIHAGCWDNINWTLPGGFGFNHVYSDSVDMTDPGHYIFNNPHTITELELQSWSYSIHGYLNNTWGASILLTDDSAESVFIESAYGDGYIVASTQPLEWGYHSGNSDLLENFVLYAPLRARTIIGTIAILEDDEPWDHLGGYNDTEELLDNYDIGYDIIPSSNFGTTDLSNYQKVIISSDQDTSFYTALDTHSTWLEDYVRGGGILEIHAATSIGSFDWILPGGFGHVERYTDSVDINDPAHHIFHSPYIITEIELQGWFYSAHGYFNNTGSTTSVIIKDSSEDPVLIEAGYGAGYIIATTQPLEFAYANAYSSLLENLVLYLPLNEAPEVTVTAPNGGETLEGIVPITWTADDPNYDSLTYRLTYWDGSTWQTIANSLPTPSWNWDTTFLDDKSGYRIRVEAFDGVLVQMDESDATFTINNPDAPQVTVISPNGMETLDGTVTVNWTASDADGDTLTYEVHYWNGTAWLLIVDGLTDTEYDWNTQTVPDGDFYKIRVVANDTELTGEDESDDIFTIYNPDAPDVTLVHPDGGETLNGTVKIEWIGTDADGDSLTYDVYYWNNTGWVLLTTGTSSTSYNWDTTTVPNGDFYKVRIIASDGTLTGEKTSGKFTIGNPVGFPGFEWMLGLVVLGVLGVVFMNRKRKTSD